MTVHSVRIGDVIKLIRRPVRIDPLAKYRQIGIYSFGKGLIRRDPILGSGLSKLRYFAVPENALVLSNIQAWEGAIAVSRSDDSSLIGSSRFLSYLPKDEFVDANYLRYYFLSESGHPLIQRASPGTTVRNRTLGIKAFENLKIPLPDIDEQHCIATWLDHLHERRREVSERAKRAARLVKAIHNVACRVDGPMARVGAKLALVREPASVDTAKKYRQIGIYSFGKGMIRRDPVPGSALSKLRYFDVPISALVLSNIQAWEGAIAISTEADKSFIASSRFLSYTSISGDADINYLRYYFLSDSGHPLIQQASPGTMVRNRTLGIKAFEDLKIPLPDIAEQRRIGCLLDRAYEVVRRIEAREKLFDALIASALNQTFGGLG
jgi:type I restriction enzyme S subunit